MLAVAPVPGKDRLHKLSVDVGGGDDEPLQIVTNASNMKEGSRIVVAPVGSTVRGDDGEPVAIKKAAVGGVMSHGMVCSAVMLGASPPAR